MIVGIGVDLVQTARVEAGYCRFGERFARRLLSTRELPEFAAAAQPSRFLARRFAAKEALAKALGTGIGHHCGLRDISVVHDARGKPGLHCDGRTAGTLLSLGIGSAHVSISDEHDYAVAFVVLERGAPMTTSL